MIRFENVCKSYGSFQVLRNCSADIGRGEVVVVCGPSGSGKSTLIKCVNALEGFDSGQIFVDGTPVRDPATSLPRLRARAGMVFQGFELFHHMTVLENIMLAQRVVLDRSAEDARARSLKLLKRVGLAHHAMKYPVNLSGGQQQRVAIARALSMDPVVMLFDEPTSALDPEMVAEVLAVMTELAQAGMTMMCVTHEMAFARQVATRILFVDQGEIIDDMPSADFFSGQCSDRARNFLERIL
ncbi:amino acid ABC transporter ATP-binding protein [Komagataeibacter xylinus]|uniref:Amino acid ABC transporter ATP-binding protein n=1 Tax=Komagataeibacter xylinus TaxID=28448 RepID=A0A857FN74_KOMXY|nr:amino acid ABC transporter ATP-binding protein [Komagataeibacter xylinus]QHC35615.1 amino acid ABC transporter ATP-binding protein [Komagataeibacter xylinus]